MRVRISATAIVAVAALTVTVLTACGGGGEDTRNASTTSPAAGGLGSAPSADAQSPTTSPAPAGSVTPAGVTPTGPAVDHPAGNPLSCAVLERAEVGNAAVPLEDIADRTIRLADGRWSTAETYLELEGTCGIGDLNGDGVFDAVSAIVIERGGTGRFYSLIAWTSDSGHPTLMASKALGDRTPVEAITISSSTHQITVVYLTRSADAPLAALNIRRTAIFRIAGNRLVEVSHTDEPYRP